MRDERLQDVMNAIACERYNALGYVQQLNAGGYHNWLARNEDAIELEAKILMSVFSYLSATNKHPME